MQATDELGDVVVTNMHRRFTGVSATVAALVPVQRAKARITLIDTGDLGLPGTMPLLRVLRRGWRRPAKGWRVWHARRDVEMLVGLFARHVLRQRWRLLFTSAAPKRHGWFLRLVINRMDAVVATSARAAGFLDWHSRIVPHGVDTDDFTPPEDKLAAFAASGLPGRYGIGCFGRIRASKGTDLFVDAMIQLLPGFPDFTAFITGLSTHREAEYKAGLERRIADAGLADRIVFLGDLPPDDVRHWYQRCLICVAASRREGFGLTPMEAMASGAVAVTSGAGYWPELIKQGVNGSLFETGNAGALSAALQPYMTTPDRTLEMGRKARGYIEENHSIRGEAAALNAIYAELQSGDIPERIRQEPAR